MSIWTAEASRMFRVRELGRDICVEQPRYLCGDRWKILIRKLDNVYTGEAL